MTKYSEKIMAEVAEKAKKAKKEGKDLTGMEAALKTVGLWDQYLKALDDTPE
jgi:hypothetical protein